MSEARHAEAVARRARVRPHSATPRVSVTRRVDVQLVVGLIKVDLLVVLDQLVAVEVPAVRHHCALVRHRLTRKDQLPVRLMQYLLRFLHYLRRH